MKRLALCLVALVVAVPAGAQSSQTARAAMDMSDMAMQMPPQSTFTPPNNPNLPPRLEDSAAELKSSTRHGEWVDIKMADGTDLKTWVVYPERADKAGVVLVIHDIFGMAPDVVAWPQAVADSLAKEGFIAIAPDLLSGKGPNGGGAEALGNNVGQAIRTLTPDDVTARLNAAMAYGKTLPASSGKTAVVGFCWGGNMSFAYAIAQPALVGAVVYYGMAPGSGNPFVPDPAKLRQLQVPIIGFFGGNDARVTTTVAPTEAAAKELGKAYEPHIFEGAGHGFLRNRNTEGNYKASEQAWPLTVAFLKAHLE